MIAEAKAIRVKVEVFESSHAKALFPSAWKDTAVIARLCCCASLHVGVGVLIYYSCLFDL